MKRILSIGLIIIVLLATFGSSVIPMDFYSTVRGMQEAAAGKPGTFMYGNGNLIVLCWQKGSGYGFAVTHQAADLADDLTNFVNANKVNLKTISDFVTWLEKNGYERIFAETLPPAAAASLRSYNLLNVIANRALPSVFIVPVVIFGTYPGKVSQQ